MESLNLFTVVWFSKKKLHYFFYKYGKQIVGS